MEPSIELTAEGLWSEVASRLRGALNETTYRTWFDHVKGLELSDDEFVLAVPNDFTRDWIEGHFIGAPLRRRARYNGRTRDGQAGSDVERLEGAVSVTTINHVLTGLVYDQNSIRPGIG